MALLSSTALVVPARHHAFRVHRRPLSHIARQSRRSGAVLDELDEVVHAQTYELSRNIEAVEDEFNIYRSATEDIEELEQLSMQLDSVVSDMDQLLLAPDAFQVEATAAERSAKRQAKRSTRKSSKGASAAAAIAPAVPSQPVPQPASSIDDELYTMSSTLEVSESRGLLERIYASPPASEDEAEAPSQSARSRNRKASTSAPTPAPTRKASKSTKSAKTAAIKSATTISEPISQSVAAPPAEPAITQPAARPASPVPARAPAPAAGPSLRTPSPMATRGAGPSLRTPSPMPAAGPSLRTPSPMPAAGPSLRSPSPIPMAGPSLRAATPAPSRAGSVSTHATRVSRNTRSTTPAPSRAQSVVNMVRSTGSSDGTTSFIKSAGSTSLLVTDEQKELATIVKDYLWLQRIKGDLRAALKRDPTTVEWAKAADMDLTMFEKRLAMGQSAKSTMLKSNYRLVISIVKKYQGRGLAMQDLITEGMQGLLRSVEKFDADKGFKFSTYAHWWIRQSVQRGIQQQTRTVRLPVHIQEQYGKIVAAKAKLSKQLQREPTVEEVAEHSGLSPAKIGEIMEVIATPMSLETPMGDSNSSEVKDMLADERLTPDELFAEQMLRQNLEQVLRGLDEREAGILRMRWGLDNNMKEATLEDIGTRFNVTRERVRQIEARAVFKLQERHRQMEGEESIMGELDQSPLHKGSMRNSRGTKKT